VKFSELSRRDLIEWAGAGAYSPRAMRPVLTDRWEVRHSHAELVGIWSEVERAGPFPSILVTREGGERDLLAWAATYLPLKPLTAFCRVIENSDVGIIEEWAPNTLPRPVAMGCVGVIFAEMILRNAALAPQWVPSLASAMETFAFVASRAVAIGLSPIGLQRLSDRWVTLQRWSGGRRASKSVPVEIWARVIAAASRPQVSLFADGGSDPLLRALRELFIKGAIDSDTWWQVAGTEFRSIDQLTIEERVKAFRRWSQAIIERPMPVEWRAFAVAYMADQIRPGSFEHVAMLRELSAEFVDASVLWYGLLAGMHSSARIGSFVNGLGWRILNEAFASESPTDRTRADISITEFTVLVENPSGRATISPMHSPRLRVELLPCVYSEIEWSDRFRVVEEQYMAVRDPLSELGAALARATEAYRELSKTERTSSKVRPDRKKK
jgi:hypothetical protein